MPHDYENYSITRSRRRRDAERIDRILDIQLTCLAIAVFVFALACAIYGAYWG